MRRDVLGVRCGNMLDLKMPICRDAINRISTVNKAIYHTSFLVYDLNKAKGVCDKPVQAMINR